MPHISVFEITVFSHRDNASLFETTLCLHQHNTVCFEMMPFCNMSLLKIKLPPPFKIVFASSKRLTGIKKMFLFLIRLLRVSRNVYNWLVWYSQTPLLLLPLLLCFNTDL